MMALAVFDGFLGIRQAKQLDAGSGLQSARRNEVKAEAAGRGTLAEPGALQT